MNKKLRIYLDTSVPNFLFADDSPEKKEITIDFFENFVIREIYRTFISSVVIAEIQKTNNLNRKGELISVVEKYPIEILDFSDSEAMEIQELADRYVENKVIPEKKLTDALHIAICVVKGIDYLVSWNYKHLANVNRENKIRLLNWDLGYRVDLRIITPLELIDYGN